MKTLDKSHFQRKVLQHHLLLHISCTLIWPRLSLSSYTVAASFIGPDIYTVGYLSGLCNISARLLSKAAFTHSSRLISGITFQASQEIFTIHTRSYILEHWRLAPFPTWHRNAASWAWRMSSRWR